MSVKGKTRDRVVVVTCCDHGESGRREVLREHYSMAAAARAYGELWQKFHREIYDRTGVIARVWQEMIQPEGGTMAMGTGRLKE